MTDDSYLIFNKNLEPYQQYPGARELFEELQVIGMVAGSCYFGGSVACYLERDLSRRIILSAFASCAKYELSRKLFEYAKSNQKEIIIGLASIQNKLKGK